ncbi:MAG: carbohydrate kinase [Planctomycetes bacterium]|nr:carbohydrate kinase [Planctomycetota bacterium]
MVDNLIAVGIGEILWDCFPGGRKLGGAPANFACHARSLGCCGVVVSTVGDDEDGRALVAELSRLGLGVDYIGLDGAHPTGTVDVVVDAKGKPEYVIHENVAWDNIRVSDSLSALAAKADAVCFGSLAQRSEPSRAAITSFLSSLNPECLKVFDINLRQNYFCREVIENSLRLCNVFKLNDEELPVVMELLGLEAEDTEGALRLLLEKFSLRLIALTRGGTGSILLAPDGFHEHPGRKAELIDTVGAGDSFTAAVTAGLLRGMPLAEINETANRIAAFVCSCEGATPDIPASILAI